MKVTINNIDYHVPFDLSEITLAQYIAYHEKYGKELDEDLAVMLQKKDQPAEEFELDIDNHLDNEAISWVSFWTKVDLFQVKNQPMIIPLLSAYRTLRILFTQPEDFRQEFEWKDEKWRIQDFKINPENEMSFNEIITSKEVMRQIVKLGLSKWDAMPYLCAIFFRKVGEKFTDDMIHENSERLVLMKQLPLSMALCVGFFLKICVSLWSDALAFSQKTEEMAELEPI